MLLKWPSVGVVVFSILSLGACSKGATNLSVNAEGGLKMREAPNVNSKTVGVVPNFATVELIEQGKEEIEIAGTQGRWMKIRFLDASGWAFGGFLSENVVGSRKIDPHEIFRNGESITFVYDGSRKENDPKQYMDGDCTAYSWKLHANGSVSGTNLHCSGIQCRYDITNGSWTMSRDALTISVMGTTPPDCPGSSQEQLTYRFDSFRAANIHIANYGHKSFEILQPQAGKSAQ